MIAVADRIRQIVNMISTSTSFSLKLGESAHLTSTDITVTLHKIHRHQLPAVFTTKHAEFHVPSSLLHGDEVLAIQVSN